MPFHFARRLALGALAALVALPAAPAFAAYQISCNSHGYRYNYCGANTNGYAQLLYQTSQAPCIRGRTWGSDGGGVWVNNGCAGQFEVGGSSSSSGGAVAAGIGLAILGAIVANQDNDNNQYDGGYVPPPYPVGGGPVPGWAVGTFSGSLWGQPQTIQIGPEGTVQVWYRNGGTAGGWFSGNTMTIGSNAVNVQPSGGGILVNGAYFGR